MCPHESCSQSSFCPVAMLHAMYHNEEAARPACSSMSTISLVNWRLSVADFARRSCSVQPGAHNSWTTLWSSVFNRISLFELALMLHFVVLNKSISKSYCECWDNVDTIFKKKGKKNIFSDEKICTIFFCYSGNTAFLYFTCLLSLG